MTFDEFIQKYTDQPVDFDGVFGVQCMDLMHQYVYDVLGLTDRKILQAKFARYVFENFDDIPGHENFEKIINTPDGIPQNGDIVFFGKPIGKFVDDQGVTQYAGHVCIFINGDAKKFKSFDANWIVTNPHVQDHTYGYCLGWLRYKKTDTFDVYTELDKCRLARDSHWIDLGKIKDALVVQGEYSLTNILNRIQSLSDSERRLGEVEQKNKELSEQIITVEAKLKVLSEEHTVLTETHRIDQITMDQQGVEIKTLQSTVQGLKNNVMAYYPKGLAKIWSGIIDIILRR